MFQACLSIDFFVAFYNFAGLKLKSGLEHIMFKNSESKKRIKLFDL